MKLCLILLLLCSGCATKGGWPCFVWQKNTDQKLNKEAQQMLQSKTNSVAK